MSSVTKISKTSRDTLRLGFVALTDCAPIVMAQELGLFAKYGLQVELQREVGWATVREKMIYGELDAAHAPAGMVIAACCGFGSLAVECLTGLVTSLNGNGITLSENLRKRGILTGSDLRAEINRRERAYTFGAVYSFSSHSFLLRQWLLKNGICPDRDVRIVVVPPQQLPANLKAGSLDGYCVGEPWNSRAVQERSGFCVASSQDLETYHPEKVLMVRKSFAEQYEQRHLALVAALIESCRFCQKAENLAQISATLSRREYLGGTPETTGMGIEKETRFSKADGLGNLQPIFSGEGVNEPTLAKAQWIARSVAGSGHLQDEFQPSSGQLSEWFREDIFAKASQLVNDNKPMKNTPASNQTGALSRRRFLTATAKGLGLGALMNGLPGGWVGGLYASEAPEVADMKFGIIALTDCSPIVIAHEKGLFKKYGINSTVAKGANWAAIRDALSNGDNQATHMLLGMPIASSMGLGGAPKKAMVVPWLLNRNGQSITIKKELAGKVGEDPKALKPYVEAAKKAGTPMSFAMTFPTGTHAMWMRYYLAAGGIHPGDAQGGGGDVSLITVPPPQMVANMKVGKMDGYCVGEPWNARAIADDIGFSAINTQAMWKDHPEKVCAFTAEFADKNPKTVKAVLKALHEASVWLDKMENRPEQAQIVSAATYINCPAETILGRLQGKYDMGDGRKFRDPNYMIFSDRNTNFPQPKYCKWWLTQFRRWGFVEGAPDYEGVAKEVMRTDLYTEAMKEIGYTHGGLDEKPDTLFDGRVFDPKGSLEAYATGFEVRSLKG
jgi:nitrate/nitrite transport system substrate-binding protein